MVCRECQIKIPDFIEERMSIEDLEEFLCHVTSCQDCYEELEIMLTICVGLQELDEEKNISYNFKDMLKEKIRQAEYKCKRYKSFYQTRGIILFFMHMILLIGIFIQILQWIS